MRSHIWLIVCGALLVLGLPSFAAESAAPSQEIASLATKPVVIDGNLSEWGASIKVGPVTFDEEVANDYNGTFRIMYDKDNLYLAAVVVEPHPPYNTFPSKGTGAWNGDDLVIRMCGNPSLSWPITMSDKEAGKSKDLFTIEFWRNHLTKMTLCGGFRGISGEITLSAKELSTVKAVVKPAADGKGYTLEARVPWQLINPGFQPKPGDKLVFVWEVNIANESQAEPLRIFQIFANGASQDSFRGPSAWGGEILLK